MGDSLNQYIEPELLVRYLSGEITALEIQAVEKWLNANVENKAQFDQLKLLWESSGKVKEVSSIDIQRDWQKVKYKIDNTSKVISIPAAKEKHTKPIQLIRVAAVVTFLVGAFLVWSILSDLGLSDMITITALKDTPFVVLPDGSEVVLNKNSRLVYPAAFDDKTRIVTLEGEAFFDVVKDPSKPFLIKSGKATTEVVGTSFSVNASIKNKIVVTVVTGRVLLYNTTDQKDKLTIIPGERGQLKNWNQLSKANNENVNFLSWKTGVLTFQNTSVDQVIEDLNKYYDQSLKLGSSALKSCTLTATFNQQSFKSVLDELQLALPIKIENKDKSIILTGGGCK